MSARETVKRTVERSSRNLTAPVLLAPKLDLRSAFGDGRKPDVCERLHTTPAALHHGVSPPWVQSPHRRRAQRGTQRLFGYQVSRRAASSTASGSGTAASGTTDRSATRSNR
jgi:hypothetical protein